MHLINKKLFFLLFILISLNCSKQAKVKITTPDKISNFFISCENDLSKAAKVISEKELTKILTHFQYMNTGGKKYYPLEREALTKMINTLVSYTYTDCILTNRRGTIIYTMYNDDIFAKNVKHISESPLPALFESGIKNKRGIADVTLFPKLSGRYDIFFSVPVLINNRVSGVLIASLNISQIKPIFSKNIKIVDKEGKIKIHKDEKLIFSNDSEYAEKKEQYTPFKYKNIEWFIKE